MGGLLGFFLVHFLVLCYTIPITNQGGHAVKLICLTENTTCNPRLQPEHGLSIYIETGEKKILLDFGQTGETLLHNAKTLEIDLALVDIAVLSHGHYDHGGGMEAFLKENQKARVYLHQNAFGAYYNGTEKYIGVNPALKGNPRLCFVDEDTELSDGIILRLSKEELVAPIRDGGLTQKIEGQFLHDTFSHELYLQVEEQGKKILFSGCAHKGIENIMAWFSPQIFVGGMHLSHFSAQELTPLAKTLAGYHTHYITGHCTGVEQAEYLKEFCQISYLSCGKALAL